MRDNQFLFGVLRALLALFLLCTPPIAGIAKAQVSAATKSNDVVNSSSSQVDADLQEARQIAALIDGILDPQIDAERLFRVSIAGSNNQLARTVLRLVRDDTFYRQAKADNSSLAPLSPNGAALALKRADFLRLPQSRQKALLEAHRQRSEDARARDAESEARRGELARLSADLDGLRNFLEGQPTQLARLDLDLVDFVAIQRDNPVIGSAGETASNGPSTFPSDADKDTQLEWLRTEIAAKKAQILALSPTRLGELVRVSGIATVAYDNIANADAALQAAQEELRDAEKQAAAARDEQTRLLANANATLLAVSQSQAEVRSDLARIDAELPQLNETTLTWQSKVDALVDDNAGSRVADRSYDELVRDLTETRNRFRQILALPGKIKPDEIYPSPVGELANLQRPEVPEILSRYSTLQQDAETLRQEYYESRWQSASSFHDAVMRLNEARLALIPALSSERRSQVTGFGSAGVSQAGREIDQITLQLQYYLQRWPRLIGEGITVTPQLVFELGWLLLSFMLFSSWRRRGGRILANANASIMAGKTNDVSMAIRAQLLDLWRRVRRPLDWAIFLAVVRWLWPAELTFPGLKLLWLVLFWTALTLFLMKLADELAKGRMKSDPRAELRWRSLRLIGGTVLAIILLLQISDAVVGQGAIYNWVTAFAWWLLPVVIFILTLWWQERIKALSELEAERSPFLGWIARRPTGWTTVIPFSIAGFFLLVTGALTAFGRQASKIALVREIGQQKAREEAERQVAEDKASGRYKNLPQAFCDSLAPHREPLHEPSERKWPEAISLPKISRGTITALVGDRGLGKSTLMRDLAITAEGFEDCLLVRVDHRGLQGVIDDLSDLGTDQKVQDKRLVVSIDDIHRLIAPAINGLEEFDELIEIVRNFPSHTACIVTLERTAWDFLERARFDRLVFDEVVQMPRWSIEETRELIERRTKQAGIEPDFGNVLDGGAFGIAGDLSPLERKKVSYFDRLYQYANGNPAVALEFWRRSLFAVADTGKVVVLTFALPKSDGLSEMPLSALIVLRVILQMGRTPVEEIERCTDLPTATISGILRRLQQIGAIARDENCYHITLDWWLEVRRLLERRNLIIRRGT